MKPSSLIAGLHYEPNLRILRVAFQSGKQYDYRNVPPEVYAELDAAESVGKAYNALVKGKYESRPVEPQPSPESGQ